VAAQQMAKPAATCHFHAGPKLFVEPHGRTQGALQVVITASTSPNEGIFLRGSTTFGASRAGAAFEVVEICRERR